jgi:hypothetical protein
VDNSPESPAKPQVCFGCHAPRQLDRERCAWCGRPYDTSGPGASAQLVRIIIGLLVVVSAIIVVLTATYLSIRPSG